MPNPGRLELPRELLIVGAAVELGILDALRTPLSLDVLAGKLGAERRGVEPVCGALGGMGYLMEENGLFSLTPAAEELFYNAQSRSYLGFSFMYDYYDLIYWLQLPDAVRSGRPASRPHQGKILNALMEKLGHMAGETAPVVSDRCLEGLGENPRVLDIGGGHLVYARAFAGCGARVTVQDLPPVVDYIRSSAEGEGSIEMVPGDFRRELPPGPFELTFLGNVCRIYGEKDNAELMEKVFTALVEGGRIAILDYVRDISHEAVFLDVNMLVHTREGRTWPLERYQRWLAGAGFSDVSMQNLGDRQLIRAKKPGPGKV